MRQECDTCKHRKTKKKHCKKDRSMKADNFDMCVIREPDWDIEIKVEPSVKVIDKNSEEFESEPDFTKFLIKGGGWNFSVRPSRMLKIDSKTGKYNIK